MLEHRDAAAISHCIRASQVQVVDGHTLPGGNWPAKIRERLKASQIVVGDVAGVSAEVFFELGFAYGLGKVIIPVVGHEDERSSVPDWLSTMQFGYYGTSDGFAGIVSSVVAHFSDPEYIKPPKPPRPIPSLAIWLRRLPCP